MDGSNVQLLAEIGGYYGFAHQTSQSAIYYWDNTQNNADLHTTDGTISGTTVVSQGVMAQEMAAIGWVWEFNGNVMVSIGHLQDWSRIYTIDSVGTMTQFDDYVEPRSALEAGNELLFTAAKDGVDLCVITGTHGSNCGGTLFRTDGTTGNTELMLEGENYGDLRPLHVYDGLLFYTRDSLGLYTTEL